ncbi:MAG: hypothetical protein QF462_03450, partial [Myxococcota bacterium]|nr:hypothetical protein [Myxococcota bacterium]
MFIWASSRAHPKRSGRREGTGQIGSSGRGAAAFYEPDTEKLTPVETRGGPVVARGGPIVARGGPIVARGGPIVARGGPIVARGGPIVARG